MMRKRLKVIHLHITPYDGMHASVISGSLHHGMARPLVEDEGTASNTEGSSEYIE